MKIVGLGLKEGHLTQEVVEAIRKASYFYYESYTSEWAVGDFKEFLIKEGIEGVELSRKEVEEGNDYIRKNAVFGVFGHPLFATTHDVIVKEAKAKGIKAKVFSGISIFDVVLAKTALNPYKFGRTVTLVKDRPNFRPRSYVEYIKKNLDNNLYTLVLTEFCKEEEYRMSPKEALDILSRNFNNLKVWVLYGIESEEEIVKKGNLETLLKEKWPSGKLTTLVVEDVVGVFEENR